MREREIADVARGQHSLITLSQARELGLKERAVRWQEERGSWIRIHDTVYALAGTASTYRQWVLAACLAIGPEAAASHRAAAQLHGLLAFKDPPVEVTTTRARSPELMGVTVHRLADLYKGWVTDVDLIPCTTPARTLVDLGAVCRPGTVEAAFDRAIGRRMTTSREVRRMMLAVARKGRRGIGTIRSVLADRLEERPAGVLEARMESLLRSAALPHAQPEFIVRDAHGGFIAIVDFAYPQERLAIEVDGYEAHVSLRAFRHDRTRDRALMNAGWTVLHFTWHEVDARAPAVVSEVAAALRRLSSER